LFLVTRVYGAKPAEGIEMKPDMKIGRGKCNIVFGGVPTPKGKGYTKKATHTENYKRLYIENGKRYDVGFNGSQIGKRPWAVDSMWYQPFTPRGGGDAPAENFSP